MFIFLFAGNEVGHPIPTGSMSRTVQLLQTTAHTLCFAFALLALHPDEQERLYEEIEGITADRNGMPVGHYCSFSIHGGADVPQTYEDMSRFTRTIA